MTTRTKAITPNVHKQMSITVAEGLDVLCDRDPWLADLLRDYITSLRAESARNRVRLRQLEAKLKGGER